MLRRKLGEKKSIQILCQIVAQLICAVDPSLDFRQVGIRGARRAGLVLNVPEVEVGAMLAGHVFQPIVGSPTAGQEAVFRRDVPPACATVMQLDDLL
jgi:hypothetical protein